MLKRLIQGACLAAIIVSTSVMASAHPHDRGLGRGEEIERSVHLNTKLRNDVLPLRRILGLGPEFSGKSLKAVELEIRPRGRTTRFVLLGDGQIIGEAWSRRGDRFVQIRPHHRVLLGRDVYRLQLTVEGSARIRNLSARLTEPVRRASRGRHSLQGEGTYKGFDRTWSAQSPARW